MRKLSTYILNYPRTLYLCMEMLHKTMPHGLARALVLGNHTPLSSVLCLRTYDGSDQACHPSYVRFRGKEFLACTPYPYGLEWYENPCVLKKVPDEKGFQPVLSAFPLVEAKNRGAEHYSDPCLAATPDKISMVFRKCVRSFGGKTDQLYRTVSADGEVWSDPVLIAEGAGDTLISPALAGGTVFCVEAVQGRTGIVRYNADLSDTLSGRMECAVAGMAPQWQVWHIDVRQQTDGQYEGLFMLRDCETGAHSQLALFTYAQGVWTMARELSLSEEERRCISMIYKSCFFKDGSILCSACDNRGRWILFRKELCNG